MVRPAPETAGYTCRYRPSVGISRALGLAAVVAALTAPGVHAAPLATWCGTGAAAADLQPDSISAFQIHVILAYPSDGADRLAQLASPIASDIETISNWWLGQDPTREPRFDLYPFPGCPSPFGALDLSSVRLPHDTSYYQRDSQRYEQVRSDLDSLGFTDPDKKYLVYFDAAVDSSSGLCGEADTGLPDKGGPDAYSIVFLTGPCASGLGSGGVATVVAVHELIHGLDALPYPFPNPGPPNACPGDQGHPCDSLTDILYPSQNASVALNQLVLDYGRDDYYGHHGSWYDVRNSVFLAQLDSPDQAPPVGPARVTATSNGALVNLSWSAATDDVGPVTYRVYNDGQLFDTTQSLSDTLAGSSGETLVLGVRADDAVGLLGPRVMIRFTVGLGIVDEAGKLVKDTVPPPAITGLYATKTRTALRLTWTPVTDLGGLKGYRVLRNGVFYALVAKPSLTVPLKKEHARWSVRAVDLRGNLGVAALIVVR